MIVSVKDAYRIVTARREMADETYEASYFIIQLVGDSDGLYRWEKLNDEYRSARELCISLMFVVYVK